MLSAKPGHYWNTILQTGMLEEYTEDHIISNHVTSICN